jgi:hypothetical protein
MSRGPTFKPGDKVVFRSNPYNKEAVARGKVKRLVSESDEMPNQQKYVVQNIATGKETVINPAEIVSRF